MPRRNRISFQHLIEGGGALTEVALTHDYLTQRGGRRAGGALRRPRVSRGAALHLALRPGGDIRRVCSTRRAHTMRSTGSRSSDDTIAWRCPSWPRPSRAWRSTPRSPSAAPAVGRTARASRDARSSTATHRPGGSTSRIATYVAAGALAIRAAAAALQWPLRRWDRAAAASADLYLANSTVVAERIRTLRDRGRGPDPPPALGPDGVGRGTRRPRAGIRALCISRCCPTRTSTRSCGHSRSRSGRAAGDRRRPAPRSSRCERSPART